MTRLSRIAGAVIGFAVMLLLCWPANAAVPQRRFALVIGNGAYQNVSKLLNPPADALSVAKALRDVGFDVTDGTDLNRSQFVDHLRDFSRKVVGADLALVYYAGHGVQVENENWLLPTDVRLRDKIDLEFEAISANSLLQGLSGARAKVLILDACRNNPFTEGFLATASNRSVVRGLARLNAADSGTLIAYATSPGAVAADGDGKNSPFAKALAETMEKPGLEIRQLFTRVRQRVVTETNGSQTPWENSSLLEDIYINGLPAPPPPVAQPLPPPLDPKEVELTYWKTIQASNEPRDFSTFLTKFPDSTFASLAQSRLSRLTAPQRPVQTTFKDCAQCPSMITIPAGSFRFGGSDDDHEKLDDETPARPVTVKTFAIGRFDITFDDWAACRTEGGCHADPSDAKFGRARRPVINVTYADSLDYVAWVSKKTGKSYRLPSEAEWEYAARGGASGPRFWGDTAAKACGFANVFDEAASKTVKFNWPTHPCSDGFVFTSPVGSFQPNAFGLYDMIGNVWQWTADCWSEHNGADPMQVAGPAPACPEHALRGGSWMSDPAKARVSARLRNNIEDSDINIGFRVVRDAP